MLCPPLGIYFLFLQIANGYQCAEYIDNWYASPKRDSLSRLTWMIPLGEFIKINYLYRNLRAICHALGFFSLFVCFFMYHCKMPQAIKTGPYLMAEDYNKNPFSSIPDILDLEKAMTTEVEWGQDRVEG